MSIRRILPVLFLLFMASCHGATLVPGEPFTLTPTADLARTLVTQNLTPIQPTAAVGDESPALPLTPSPVSPATAAPSPNNPTETALPSAAPAFQLCSPLAWETIPELPEIVSDPYNPPPPGHDERHQGVDFSHYSRKGYTTIEGEPVQAVLGGRVASVIQDRLPYGNMVMVETPASGLPLELRKLLGIDDGESLYLLYAHFAHPPLVELGGEVACGQAIGDVGATGYNVVNPHLHLEARVGPSGVTFESMAFYTTSATQAEMDNYRRWRTSGEFNHFDPMELFNFVIANLP